jgi:hypothetical protein
MSSDWKTGSSPFQPGEAVDLPSDCLVEGFELGGVVGAEDGGGSVGCGSVRFSDNQIDNDDGPYIGYYPDRHRAYQLGRTGTGW